MQIYGILLIVLPKVDLIEEVSGLTKYAEYSIRQWHLPVLSMMKMSTKQVMSIMVSSATQPGWVTAHCKKC